MENIQTTPRIVEGELQGVKRKQTRKKRLGGITTILKEGVDTDWFPGK